jgi:hypothetical protein
MAIEVSASELLRLRQSTQRLDPAARIHLSAGIHAGAAGRITETVRQLLAIQAQDFAQALWAIALRTAAPSATGVLTTDVSATGSSTTDSATVPARSDVLAALERGHVVRTLPMRGTLHFVPAEDLRWMLSLTAQRSLQSVATRFRSLGLDQNTLDHAAAIARAGLEGNRTLSRDQFMKLLASEGLAPDGQRGYHVIFYLSQLALVCWGPPLGTQQGLVLVDEWIPPSRLLTRDEALREFAVRYFTGHGPATERDFAWWTKLTLTDARAAIASAASQLTELTHQGTSYWIATSELDAATESPLDPAVHLLPGFDEYLLGYQDRSLMLAAEHAPRIVSGSNGIFLPMIVADGRVVGTWRRIRNSTTAEVEAEHFEQATPSQHAGFERAAAEYRRFALG